MLTIVAQQSRPSIVKSVSLSQRRTQGSWTGRCRINGSLIHTQYRKSDLIAIRAASGGGGDIGGGNGGQGGGDDGHDGDDAEEQGTGIMWKGWQERVAADPEFVYKVLVEQIIGVGASVVGDMSSRPNWGLNELDFVFATLIVGSIVNFSLMYLLAPTASASASTGFIAKFFGDHYMRLWGAPSGHMFEPGYALGKRALNFAYKGTVFASIGISAGLIGTAISNGLIAVRKKMDPSFIQQNESPNVLANASCWALHMGISSNLRYQLLNGMDMVIQPIMPQSSFRLLTSVVRSANNVIGGMSFVTIAKVLGVQKSAEPVVEETDKGKKTKKKKSG